jgi:hypothetical protein
MLMTSRGAARDDRTPSPRLPTHCNGCSTCNEIDDRSTQFRLVPVRRGDDRWRPSRRGEAESRGAALLGVTQASATPASAMDRRSQPVRSSAIRYCAAR